MSGTTATLGVVAAGTAPLSYQWYLGNSPDTTTPVGGATAANYTTPALVAPASYWVRVSNIVGPANSNTANITIGPAAGAEMVTNGNFGAGSTNWSVFEEPDIIWSVVSGVFQFYRANPTTTPSSQATVFQATGQPVAAGAPMQASFRIGNSSTARKRISVLVIDSNFSDITVCTFWLPPGTPLTLYTMNTHSTKAWTSAAIYFYAATKGQDGGNYLLDDVSLTYQPAISNTRTDCIDPLAPAAPGGVNGPNLLTNGDFATGTLAPWGTFGTITQQIAANVLEFIRPNATPPSGVVLQSTAQAMTANQIMTATFQLGNSSAVRKRVTVLLHDLAFGDLMACTYWVPPGQGLLNYSIKGYATVPWANATLSVYPATTGMETWIRFDNATLFRSPTSAPFGTECVEPVPTPASSWSAAAAIPIPILDQAVTSVGGNLYSFGGVSNGVVVANAYRFDGATWTAMAPLPAALEFPAAVTDGTNIFILGGALTGTGTPQTTLYRYNVGSNTYTPLAPFTTGTWNHAAVYLNGKIYKFAGTGPATASTNVHEIYDVAGNSWAPGATYPLAISFVSAFAHGNFVYAAGGLQTAGSVPSQKAYRYDPLSNTWDDPAIGDLPATRWAAATALHDGVGVLAGGYVGGTATANISTSAVAWHPTSNTWLTLSAMSAERARMTGGVLSGSMHVIGGRSVASPGFNGTSENQKLTLTAAASAAATGSRVVESTANAPSGSGDPSTASALTAPPPAGAPAGGPPAATRRTPGDESGVIGIAATEDGPRTVWQQTFDLRDADDVGLSLESWLVANESTASIEISLDGRTWSAIGVPPPTDEWLMINVDLSPYAGQVVHVRMRFDGVAPRLGRAADIWGIRDVRVTTRR